MSPEAEKHIKKIFQSPKKYNYAFVGHPNAGLTTYMNAFHDFWGYYDCEKVVFPSYTVKNWKTFFHSPYWKKHYKGMHMDYPTVSVFQSHEEPYYTEAYYPTFFKYYDFVFDFRKLPDGTRVLYSILQKKGNTFTYLYCYDKQDPLYKVA